MTDLRLVWPALTCWVAAGIVIGFPAAALWVCLVGFAFAAVLVVLRLPTVAVCCAGAALVCVVIAVVAPARSPPVLESGRITGSVIANQTLPTGEQWRGTLVAVAEGAGSDGTGTGTGSVPVPGAISVPVSVPVLVFGEAPAAGIGSVLTVEGSVVAADAGDDIAYLVFLDEPAVVTAAPPVWLDWANSVRSGFRAQASTLPGDGGALLPGLAIGDTTSVSPELGDAMKASSLTHLTAVSGANCAIVIGLVLMVGGRLGAPRVWRIVVALGVLVAFIVLVTPEPSVVRAGVMAVLVLLALLAGRPVRGIPVLALATIVLLVLDPWLSRNFGFILSVLATGGLLLLAGPLTRLLARWLPLWVAAVLAVPIAAQIACQPVIVLLQPTIPMFGVIANLLAAAAAPIATVVGLLACLALAIVPPLGTLLVHVAWLPSAWIAAVAHFFAGLPGAVPWLPGAPGAVLLALCTALALIAVFRRRRWAAVGALAVLVALGSASAAVHVTQAIQRPADWIYAGCDVGQGDAFLVRSAGQTALIDTGPEPAPLADCLSTLGISHLDLLVLTHFDLDHVGGAAAVLGMADQVLVGPSGSPDDDALVATLRDHGATVDVASRGLNGVLGEYRWSVFWPVRDTEPGNGASVTMSFDPATSCACLSALFLGDLGEDSQNSILALAPLPRVDIVKVAHHGSADQSAELYERVDATVGLIGVGENDYGHPTASLLELLAREGIAVERSDIHGLVLVSPGDAPGEVMVWTERTPDGGGG